MTQDRRSRKRLATRQAISTVATRLFLEKGFDQVTIDEIAVAADVGRMTVFNHFARKEDLFFDRDEELRALLRQTLAQRAPDEAPVVSLQRLARRLAAEQHPLVEFSAASRGFVATIEASETLKARARAIRDELAADVAVALAESVGRKPGDRNAGLAAGLLLATWTVALVQAHATFRRTANARTAKAAFIAIIDKGTVALVAALAGTDYV